MVVRPIVAVLMRLSTLPFPYCLRTVVMRMRVVSVAVRVIGNNNVSIIVLALGGDHTHFGGADPAAVYSFDLEPSLDSERRDGLAKQFGVDSGVHQSAQHHVSADAGKAVEISDSHVLLLPPQLRLPATSVTGSSAFIEPDL